MADVLRTCKDDNLPFCAFCVHEQFVIGYDRGHGGRADVQVGFEYMTTAYNLVLFVTVQKKKKLKRGS